jgi:ParB family chromosome partitioning protein
MPTRMIASNQIDRPLNPSRFSLDPVSVQSLADSIREHGLLQPLTVRALDGRYRVVAGDRRFMACNFAGMNEIECKVVECDDETEATLRAIENLEREDLTPVEEAVEVRRLQEKYDLTHERIAERLKRSVAWVKSRLQVLVLPEDIIRALHTALVSLGVALELGKVENEQLRTFALNNAINYGMTIDNAKAIVAEANKGTLLPTDEALTQATENYIRSPHIHRITCHVCEKRFTLAELTNVFVCHEDALAIAGAAAHLPQQTASFNMQPARTE